MLVGEVRRDSEFLDGEPLGQVSGIAIATDDSAWVVDQMSATAFLVPVAGPVADRVGGEGDGPGDLKDGDRETDDENPQQDVGNVENGSQVMASGRF